ncbi:MAG: methylated-DNA--[protein]-cysteine S-methyltransferase [Methanomicrobiales archaeon]
MNNTDFKIKLLKKTPFGPVAIIWTYCNDMPIIYQIFISNPENSAIVEVERIYPDSSYSTCPEINNMATNIEKFLAGENICFSLDDIALYRCSKFQEAVLKAEYQIPRGRVSIYQDIARRIGNDKAARAVGNALARNPFPLIIPCHRAIRSDGSLGGFQGGEDMKRALLENEGIRFKGGRIINRKFYF